MAQSNISITGTVTDSVTGLPIADAVVEIGGRSETVYTGANGLFEFHSIPPGHVQVQITRVGYRPYGPVTVEVIEGFTRSIDAALVRLPVRMPDQTVEHRGAEAARDLAVRRYTRDEFVNAGYRTLGDVLEAMPGVTVYANANAPGGTRVSVGGERPHRVAVLFDGLPLDGGADGAVDLDAIPLSAVTEITVMPGAQSSSSGDAAIGGVVDIRTAATHPRGAELTLHAGQYDEYGASVHSVTHLDQVTANLSLEHTQRGNRFTYPSGDSTATRMGTKLDSWRGFAALSPRHNSPVRVSGFYYGAETGLPGALEQATPDARNTSARVRVQGTWRSNPRHAYEFGAGVWFESSREHFVSPVRLRADSKFEERFVGGRVFGSRRIAGIGVRGEIEARKRRLAGTDYLRPHLSFGVHDRSEFSLRGRVDRSFRLGSHVLSGSAGATIDGDNVSSPFHAPRIDVGWSMPVGLHLRAGWGQSFRRPLLTSLFWKADAYAVGNPDLKPESAEEWEVGVGLRRGAVSIDSRYFDRDVENIIVWQRSTVSGQYQPLNIDRTRVIGREDHFGVRLFEDAVVLDYTHVFTSATDQSGDVNYKGQTLVLTPRHTHDASLSIRVDRWRARTSGRWVSLRHIRRQNNPDKALAPYRVFDARLTFALSRQSPSTELAFEVSNVTNEYYELLERYPSPGRAWLMSVAIHL
ncbi:MAG: TonB-dependent receptor [Candidatus Zixiibacteriota bacterium]